VIGPVIGHLGPRVSALLDGQLSPADEERAWDHVHSCHLCRDAVEREGWVKTRLATMQYAGSETPSHLKGSLLFQGIAAGWAEPGRDAALVGAEAHRTRRHLGLTGIGGGAIGAAVMGVLALGASPANAPGAMVRSGDEPFGTSLTQAIAAIVDREAPAALRRGADAARPDTPSFEPALRRTLAP
jgi:anti-sigma factor RsiW